MSKLVIILLIISLILPDFSFSQEDQAMKAPEGSEELKEFGKKFLEFLPKVLKEAWQEAVKIWREVREWFKNLWNSYIFPWFKSIWQEISNFFLTSIWERFKKLIL